MTEASLNNAFRAVARRRLPRRLFEYIESGGAGSAGSERNIADLGAVSLQLRTLHGASESVRLETEVLGQRLSMPVILGPVGLTGMYARRGEVQGALAAKASQIALCQPMLSICSVEEVAAAASPPWFQICMMRDRAFMKALLDRLWALGCPVLVLTADVAIIGDSGRAEPPPRRPSPFPGGSFRHMVDGLRRPRWLHEVYLGGRPHSFGNMTAMSGAPINLMDYWAWIKPRMEPTVTVEQVEWLRANWAGRLVVKGILHVDDARAAVDAGADGIVVSNHGGRRSAVAQGVTAALPRISDAIGDRTTILMDSGVRSGHDVVRALALGAQACLLGRAWIYALVAEGQDGVVRLLDGIREDIAETTMHLGLDDVRRIDRRALAAVDGASGCPCVRWRQAGGHGSLT